jgi:hypothetical protein
MQAIDNWPKLVTKAQQLGAQLGSPATSQRATTPGGWMEQFMNEACPFQQAHLVCL